MGVKDEEAHLTKFSKEIKMQCCSFLAKKSEQLSHILKNEERQELVLHSYSSVLKINITDTSLVK